MFLLVSLPGICSPAGYCVFLLCVSYVVAAAVCAPYQGPLGSQRQGLLQLRVGTGLELNLGPASVCTALL